MSSDLAHPAANAPPGRPDNRRFPECPAAGSVGGTSPRPAFCHRRTDFGHRARPDDSVPGVRPAHPAAGSYRHWHTVVVSPASPWRRWPRRADWLPASAWAAAHQHTRYPPAHRPENAHANAPLSGGPVPMHPIQKWPEARPRDASRPFAQCIHWSRPPRKPVVEIVAETPGSREPTEGVQFSSCRRLCLSLWHLGNQ